jgi:hypothetical protein
MASQTGLRSNVELQVLECQNVEKDWKCWLFRPYPDNPPQGLGAPRRGYVMLDKAR